MTKDFKNKQNTDAPLNDVVSWILAGIALGLFIGLMVYLFSGKNEPPPYNQIAATSPSISPASDLSARDRLNPEDKKKKEGLDKMAELDQIIEDNITNGEEDTRPTFDYHVILPTLDVEVPVARPTEQRDRSSSHNHKKTDKEKSKKKKSKTEKVAIEKITKPGNYVIQVGAYKRKSDAKKMKKKVSSLGINAYVETATAKGATWHRVRIGPLSDLNKVNKIRSQLSAKGIASFQKSVR